MFLIRLRVQNICRRCVTGLTSKKTLDVVRLALLSSNAQNCQKSNVTGSKEFKDITWNYVKTVMYGTSGTLTRANTRNIYTSCHASQSRKNTEKIGEWRENKVFTVPNVLCFGRIIASPFLGYFVIAEQYLVALLLFIAAGFTDMLDGFIARQFPSQESCLGSVLDPIADKILVGVLTVSLSVASLLPVPLAIVILGRDIGLILASFVVRFISLPQPRTFSRFFDFQLPTVQITPSTIGKINTALQLALISLMVAAPIFEITEHAGLIALQYTVGVTTIISGLDYFIRQNGFNILEKD